MKIKGKITGIRGKEEPRPEGRGTLFGRIQGFNTIFSALKLVCESVWKVLNPFGTNTISAAISGLEVENEARAVIKAASAIAAD
jgi:hypothetical protein